MGMIVRREFLGKRWLLWLLFVVPLAFPLGIIYLVEGTVTVHEELDDPAAFIEKFRAREER